MRLSFKAPKSDGIPGLFIAYVADELEFRHGCTQGYDVTADYAASLLRRFPDLMVATDAYATGRADLATFANVVGLTVRLDTATGGE